MADAELLTYAELAEVVDHLPLLLREERRQHGLTMRQAGDQIGVAPSTVLRLEAGKGVWSDTIVAVLRWLDRTTPDPGTAPGAGGEATSGDVTTSDEGSEDA